MHSIAFLTRGLTAALAALIALIAPIASIASIASGALAAAAPGDPGDPPAVLENKVTASDGSGGDWFGSAVGLAGDTLVVGATYGSGTQALSGSAYVFARSGTGWNEVVELTAPDAALVDNFGAALAIWDDTIAVGSGYDDDGGADSGSAWVFVDAGSGWTREAKLTAPDAAANDFFGERAVALRDDTLLVGARGDDDAGPASGSVWVFVRTGSGWSAQAKLTASDGGPQDNFGAAAALTDDLAVIGAWRDDQGAGSVFVFRRAGAVWTEEARLVAADREPEDRFGNAVAVFGDTIVVGAFQDDVGTASVAGSAWVFVHDGASWVRQTQLVAATPWPTQRFGSAVAVDGDRIAVGAPGASLAAGAVHTFVRAGSTWTAELVLVAGDAQDGDELGGALALSGGTIAAGARHDDDLGTSSGAVYAYDLAGPPTTYCTAKPNSCGTLPAIAATGRASAAAGSGFVVRAARMSWPRTALLVYGLSGADALPFMGGTLCVAPPLGRTVAVVTAGTGPVCDGDAAIDMNAFASGLLGGNPAPSLGVAGTAVHAQWWARDDVPFGAVLSDGLAYVVGP